MGFGFSVGAFSQAHGKVAGALKAPVGRGGGLAVQGASVVDGRDALPARGHRQLGVGGRAATPGCVRHLSDTGALRHPRPDRQRLHRGGDHRPLRGLRLHRCRAAPGVLGPPAARLQPHWPAPRPGRADRSQAAGAGFGDVSQASARSSAWPRPGGPSTPRACGPSTAARSRRNARARPGPAPTCSSCGPRCGRSPRTRSCSRPTTPQSRRCAAWCSSARSPGQRAACAVTNSCRVGSAFTRPACARGWTCGNSCIRPLWHSSTRPPRRACCHSPRRAQLTTAAGDPADNTLLDLVGGYPVNTYIQT